MRENETARAGLGRVFCDPPRTKHSIEFLAGAVWADLMHRPPREGAMKRLNNEDLHPVQRWPPLQRLLSPQS